jgi:hypothetical protein
MKRYSLRISNKGYLRITTNKNIQIVYRWRNNLGNWWDVVLDICQ